MKRNLLSATVAFALLLTSSVGTSAYANDGQLKALNDRAGTLYREGNYDRAEELANQSLAVAEKSFGPDHPAVATSLNNLAELYLATNRIPEADQFQKRAKAILAIKR